MSDSNPNPKLVGAFVLGGIVLLTGASVLLSSSDLFTPRRIFVAYFQQSVNGLNVGAPIKFRGIPVGEVLEIEGLYDPDTGNMIPRLILEFRPETMRNAEVEEGEYTLLPALLEAGLRASLQSQSLLTGQLYVGLDFHPNTPARYLGEDDEYPEMPTIDSGFDELIAEFSELPIDDIVARAISTLATIENILKNPNIDEVLAALPVLLTDTDSAIIDLMTYVNGGLAELTDNATATLQTTRHSLDTVSLSFKDDYFVRLNVTLDGVDQTLQLVRQRLERQDPLTYEALAALREITRAARSIREFADDLEAHPESLLRGR